MIAVVTTIGDLPADRRRPVIEALRANLALPEVSEICILTERRIDWLKEMPGAAHDRIRIEHMALRPTFTDLFALANSRLEAGARVVAISNADVSFADAISAQRLVSSLEALAETDRPIVFALTRHDQRPQGLILGLYETNGLPNTLSADMWAFSEPLKLSRNLFYSPGQMNCDMLLTHDLLGSGCDVYNPCLDIVVKHHEAEKDESFYREKNSDEKSLEPLWKHTALNNVDPWNYYGNTWVRTSWLRAGFRPSPVSTNHPKLFIAVPLGMEGRLPALLPRLLEIAKARALEVLIVCDGEADRIVSENLAVLACFPGASVSVPLNGVGALRKALLAGDQHGMKSIAFVGDIERIDNALLAATEGVFLTLRDHPSQPPPVEFGCTLVTSVFRAEPFMSGFLSNCTLLVGYGRQIEHAFLVSVLSHIECDLLDVHLSRYSSVVVIWNRDDPGLYECWNIGIRLARTPYVSNANVDDLRDPAHVATLVADLECQPDAQVAATALNPFYDFPPDGTLPGNKEGWYADRAGRFGFYDLAYLSDQSPPGLVPHNMPHCMPVWRRALHDRYGWFNEARYGTYADWAFWLNALQDGASGWLNPAPLAFYYVNPTSHNRRGTDLERLHQVVEDEFLADFVAQRDGQRARRDRAFPEVPRKLALHGQTLEYGQHRNAFGDLVRALLPLECEGDGGVLFVPFLERQFVWGDAPGEAGSADPQPLTRPWTGILHVPFESPRWFEGSVHPETFMTSRLFEASRPACRGIITLSRDLEADLNVFAPGLPTLSVLHPTRYDAEIFDVAAYRAAPAVVQVGDWLRRLQAIHRLRAPGHKRIMLLKRWTTAFMDHEISMFGDYRDPAVEMLEFVSNDRYDSLLSTSVVLCMLYCTAANNVVIECIARATPILINPLPSVVEYLGVDYPLYATDEAKADAILETPGAVEEAHDYLLRRRQDIDLSYEGFCRNIARSGFYADL